MKYNLLGKSDLSVSEVSFGCMSLGDDDAENKQLLHQALDKGINFFDTADLYAKGENERTVGKAFQGMRDQVYIATKVGNQWRPDGSGWDWNPRKEYILQAVDKSLQRLQTAYIDLYQLHGGTIDDPMDETIEAFELLQQQGKIRYFGISSIRPNVVREFVIRSSIVSVMMQYSLLDRRPEEAVLPLLQQHNIGVLARGSLAQGLLAGKPAKPYLNYVTDEVRKAAEAVSALAGESGNAAATAVRYVLQQPAITTAVLGIRTNEHLKDALAASTTTAPLADQAIQKLQAALPLNKYEQHR
ncbi:aldo/keto reductase [Pontibacter akesuensis]|uniref:Predicted oxidoreductase n=1 Tax=Pontibacter akesuensis TaxID=388950 RepID=A0A1I7FUP6_9BACT|nr:aldo/keto reductase [Pontibacter akesuensis]GHA60427.1 D-threo-aldose 1-dehydrogenase [Pontibacter akesuensis]SFU39860.1 Predicted oxidoreductase [Pontibacter akesuensis]